MNLLITNAHILTMDKSCPKAQSAVVLDQYFAYVGTQEGAENFVRASNETFETLDAKGQLLLPGFNDAHLHFLHYVKSKQSANLFSATSLKEVLHILKTFKEEHPPQDGFWICGEGWNQDYFTDEQRFPTAKDLDIIAPDHPMIILRACFHVGVLNTKAMECIGLTKEKASEYGDYVGKNPDATPNGIVREYVLDDIKAAMPSPSVEELVQLLLDAQVDLFEQGITSIQSDDVKYVPEGGHLEFFDRLRDSAQKGLLKVRYAEQALLDTPQALEEFFQKGYGSNFGHQNFKISCHKLLTDGSLGARSAYMGQPYHDDPSTSGLAIYTQKELNHLVYESHKRNLPVALHGIGYGAIDMCLNAIENACNLAPHLHPHHGIVHAQITDKSMLARMKDLGVVVFAQPIFTYYDMHIVYPRVGQELAQTSYAWKSMRDLGIPCAYSTDAPVEKFDTMPNLYCAVTRKDFKGNGPYLPEEKVSMEEALEAYTLWSAYATGEEKIKGAIKSGYLADFILVDNNLLEAKEESILTAKIVSTYIGGKCVYTKSSPSHE